MNWLNGMIAAAVLVGAPAAARAGSVEVDLSGVRAGGKVYVSLQSRGEFMQDGGSYGNIVNEPKVGSLRVSLADVKPGEYAVSVWHDDDGNGKFDFDPATGQPLDGWAMINGDTIRAKPEFDQVKIAIGAEGAKVPLPMRYSR